MRPPAVAALADAGIAHRVCRFDPALDAAAAAAALELPVAAIFKTLAVASMPRVVLACLPADRRLDLDRLRSQLGEGRAALIAAQALSRMTSFDPGAVTPIPLAGRRRFPVYLDTSANDHPLIGVGGGEAGWEILLAPADLIQLTGATVADLID